MRKCIIQLQVKLLNYLSNGKWPYDDSASFWTYSFVQQKGWSLDSLDNLLRTSRDAKAYPKRSPNGSEQDHLHKCSSNCSSTFSSYMIIIYDDHLRSSYMMITYDHRIWWSPTIIIQDDHLRSSYIIITYDHHIWW